MGSDADGGPDVDVLRSTQSNAQDDFEEQDDVELIDISQSLLQESTSRNKPSSFVLSENDDEDFDVEGEDGNSSGAPSDEVETRMGKGSNWLSLLFIWWILPVLIRGYKKPLQAFQLFRLTPEHTSEDISQRFQVLWNTELEKKRVQYNLTNHISSSSSSTEWKTSVTYKSLVKVLFILSWRNNVKSVASGIVNITSSMLQPVVMNFLLTELSKETIDLWLCSVYGAIIVVMYFCGSITWAHQAANLNMFGMHNRTAVANAIFSKSLRLEKQADRGNIVTLMSVDAEKMDNMAWNVNLLWYGPVILVVAFFLLLHFVGIAALGGVLVMMVLAPFNIYIVKNFHKLQEALMNLQDERVKLISEYLQGILVIKLFGWEIKAVEKLKGVRDQQLKKLVYFSLCLSMIFFLFYVSTTAMATTIFTFYSLLGSDMTPQVVFPAFQILGTTSWALFELPAAIASITEGLNSVRRVTTFLLKPDLESHVSPPTDHHQINDVAISIRNGNFMWPSSETPTLKNLSFDVQQGELIAIVGEVGSGKTSLLSSLLSEIPSCADVVEYRRLERIRAEKEAKKNKKISSSKKSFSSIPSDDNERDSSDADSLVEVSLDHEEEIKSLADSIGGSDATILEKPVIHINGSIAYVPQEAWIRNSTLKGNIICDFPFFESNYQNALSVCALGPDIEMLPAGDQTEIGERGINLSGGQKQRINVARAVYSNREIVLLDDPLSAVDAHVGKHIFDQCIKGALASTTRLLVTHQLQFLPFVDRIIVLKDGSISNIGTFKELTEEQGVNFSSLVVEKDQPTDDPQASSSSSSSSSSSPATLHLSAEELEKEELRKSLNKSIDDIEEIKETKAKTMTKSDQEKGKLIEKEERETGTVKMGVYKKYFGAAGGWKMIALLSFICVSSEVINILNSYWLSYWSGNFDTIGASFAIAVYASLGVTNALFILGRQLLWAFASWSAAKFLHEGMLNSVFASPLSFFHSTPQGRIVNRFSKDQNSVDTTLPEVACDFIVCLFYCTGKVVLVAIAVPIFLLFVLPVLAIFFAVVHFFRKTSRELKRLVSISNSPIYSHFEESLNGLDTVRAYGLQPHLLKESKNFVDEFIKITFNTVMTDRWLVIMIGLVSTLLLLIAVVLVTLSSFEGWIDSALAGMALVSAGGITGALSWMVRCSTQLEAEMSKVERISNYSTLPPETNSSSVAMEVPENWPSQGKVEFRNVVIHYRSDLPPALKDISFVIEPRQKIGVVGRTGAGKSSLTMALFRIVKASQGSIIIDGIDISTISLLDLRHRLSIISQDPVLFSGSIRSNLDPYSSHEDFELWSALKSVNLHDVVSLFENKLDHTVSEGGKNFSNGQRQLFCLARALLRKSSILVMDEATASVDPETDDFIQKTIRKEFGDRTIITIAHRLPTIIDYDRVLVLDAGKVAEFGTPWELVNSGGIFQQLIERTGPLASQFLRSAAHEAHNRIPLSLVGSSAASSHK